MLDVMTVIMQGDNTYCMKYGHDFWTGRWEIVENEMYVCECARCGAKQVMFL